ncbi:hypothetical protein COU20_04040 [Candidatus Kaiserbacteria bacterium CG10_big_fil_rev_8_21_14_0_10_59_10]|uniref:AAA+ ATPase domain-containing protein n=1 Tax=Candidatus Kaiserbacteria bacterium CG10_big_fil_rev_8_21_14_0_10_59_10 TaxID=1974612 RepID=A0A2H0U724_9BACT|nr:MAG: hypothetical protein COU20_04040 [Candidatus Kaiserbacteria bacterium CG10_big_fil_rev_8_21_14_0_10_59_10]
MNNKIIYHDLREEGLRKRLPAIIGREEETDRLNRLVGRRVHNNALIVGPSGIGKTALIWGWARRICTQERYKRYAFLQLDAGHVYELENDARLEEHWAEALRHVPACVLFIDDIGRELYRNVPLAHRLFRLYRKLLTRPDVHVVLALQPHEHTWLESEYPAFARAFETVILKDQTAFEYQRILLKKIPALSAMHRVIVPDSALREIVAMVKRFPTLGQLPRAGIHLLDESISLCIAQERKIITTDQIAQVVEAKTGVPRTLLTGRELRSVRHLQANLSARVVDQEHAIAQIAKTLQRAKLGIRNPRRPLGSFLLLGPSGVGKTETAKCVAESMFGRRESFKHIDMSEFQQEHTVQRLIGAPPGYIGYEEGGALTNALRQDPHSLILLDEIEKAHPKVFDIFLQILDEGRLTSGKSETVDARNSIFMATSNAALPEIVSACANGEDVASESFLRERMLPILARSFRLEFLNRFDHILVFKPLTVSGLMRIAHLEIRKTEQRLAKHSVRFAIEPDALESQVRRLEDPRFGARPIKRFIEETCETLLAESLLTGNAEQGPRSQRPVAAGSAPAV